MSWRDWSMEALPQRERFAMGISDVAQKFELTARTREVNLHIDVPGPLPLINADVSMIEGGDQPAR